MNSKKVLNRIIIQTKRLLTFIVFRSPRILKYNLLSSCNKIDGSPIKNGPVLMNGLGTIYFGKNVNLGYVDSPYYYNSYIYIEARNSNSKIEIKSDVYLNNNTCIVSEGYEGITIGSNTLIGTNVTIYDSDFHDLDPCRRFHGTPETAGIRIGDNVFIGSNVTILKGVEIGDNSVIGNGSVVSKSIPKNVIAAGNPCKVIKSLTS